MAEPVTPAASNIATNADGLPLFATPMPEPAFYEPDDASVAPPLYSEMKPEENPNAPRVDDPQAAKIKPEPELEPEPEKPKEPTPAPAPSAKHSPETVTQAINLGLTHAEIDAMSPLELVRLNREMSRIAQAAWDAAKKSDTPKAEAEKKPATPEYDLEKNELAYNQEVIQAMRDSREAKAEAKALKEQLQSLQADRVHDRLDRHVAGFGEEAAKALDRSTAAGQQKFHELLVKMKFVQDEAKAFGKDMPEKEIMQEALYRMRIGAGAAKKDGSEQDAKVEAALAAKKIEHDESALARPESRSKTQTIHEIVRDKLKKFNAKVDAPIEDSAEVEWLPGPKAN